MSIDVAIVMGSASDWDDVKRTKNVGSIWCKSRE